MEPRLWVAESALNIRDAVVDGSWCFFVNAPLPDEEAWPIAYGAAMLDDKLLPLEGPRFMIDSRVKAHGISYRLAIGDEPTAQRVSLSELVIRHAIALFASRYGVAPKELPGRLAFDNKRHFYNEYLKLLDEEAESQHCHVRAVRRISFGRCREVHGYSTMSVHCTGDDIIYWEGPPERLIRVPQIIDVNAWRG